MLEDSLQLTAISGGLATAMIAAASTLDGQVNDWVQALLYVATSVVLSYVMWRMVQTSPRVRK
jgi:membrane protein implicated in regulation of membrane protease activity